MANESLQDGESAAKTAAFEHAILPSTTDAVSLAASATEIAWTV